MYCYTVIKYDNSGDKKTFRLISLSALNPVVDYWVKPS